MGNLPSVKMSAKGQLVVPEEIRIRNGFKPGDRFIVVAVAEGVLFKRIQMPDMKRIFAEIEKDLALLRSRKNK